MLAALDRDPTRSDARRRHAADRLAELHGQLLTTLSALIVVEHASRCRRDPDDDRCVLELEEQCAEAAVRVDQLCAELLPASTPAQGPGVGGARPVVLPHQGRGQT